MRFLSERRQNQVQKRIKNKAAMHLATHCRSEEEELKFMSDGIIGVNSYFLEKKRCQNYNFR
jgi:hypothetical protein